MDSVPQLLDAVAGYLDQGYLRIKLKIEPGWDLDPVAAVRERFGDDLLLQVDANAAYTLADAGHLAGLDRFGLLLIEQPLDEDDLAGHAELARRLATPVCLDESITSARAAVEAVRLGACRIVNVKAGRVGGYLEARRLHDACRDLGVPLWCGGMLETGIGRAANVALAALPGFTLPGDTSASDRYYRQDLTAPFVLDDGHLEVPAGPGIGVEPLPERAGGADHLGRVGPRLGPARAAGQPVHAQGLVGRLEEAAEPGWLQPPMVPPEVMPWARLPAYMAPPLSPGWVQMLVRVRPNTVPSA